MPNVVIIAPHSKCPEGPRRCDTRAKQVAEGLHRKIPGSVLFTAPEFRSVHDYNRDSSFNTDFRRRIRHHINSLPGKTVIYEVHSFPDKTTEFGEHQMVVFDIDQNYEGGECLMRYLDLGLDIVQRMGDPVVSLQQEFKGPNRSHHLLEFNESHERLTLEQEGMIIDALAAAYAKKIFPYCHASVVLAILCVLLLLLIVEVAFGKHVGTSTLEHIIGEFP